MLTVRVACVAAALAIASTTSFAAQTSSGGLPATLDTSSLLDRLPRLLGIQKDKFESTGDFNKRLCAETAKVLGTNESDLLVLPLKYGENETFFHYNADKKRFDVRLSYANHFDDDARAREDVWRWEPSIDKLKWTAYAMETRYKQAPEKVKGTNAFGVSRDITVSAWTKAVVFVPSNVMSGDGGPTTLPATPQEARKLDGDLRVAIIGRLQKPCFAAGHGHHSPTLDYLYDTEYVEYAIFINPKSEWVIYRQSTKEIMKRGRFK